MDKREEYTLTEATQASGDLLRGTGQRANIDKKKTRLWNDVMERNIESMHRNTRRLKEVKKEWNNLKASAKARIDCSRREARMIEVARVKQES